MPFTLSLSEPNSLLVHSVALARVAGSAWLVACLVHDAAWSGQYVSAMAYVAARGARRGETVQHPPAYGMARETRRYVLRSQGAL